MDFRAIVMGLTFALMWSSAFTSARIAVAYASPLAMLSLRFLISGLIAVVIARALGQTASLTRKQWTAVILFGICQNAIYLAQISWPCSGSRPASPPSSPAFYH